MYNTGLCSVAFYHTISKWPQRYRTPSNRKYGNISWTFALFVFLHAVSAFKDSQRNAQLFLSMITNTSIHAMHTALIEIMSADANHP